MKRRETSSWLLAERNLVRSERTQGVAHRTAGEDTQLVAWRTKSGLSIPDCRDTICANILETTWLRVRRSEADRSQWGFFRGEECFVPGICAKLADQFVMLAYHQSENLAYYENASWISKFFAVKPKPPLPTTNANKIPITVMYDKSAVSRILMRSISPDLAELSNAIFRSSLVFGRLAIFAFICLPKMIRKRIWINSPQ